MPTSSSPTTTQLNGALDALASGKTLATYASANDLSLGSLRLRLLADDYADQYRRAYEGWINSLPEQAVQIADDADRDSERVARLQAETRTRVYSVYVGAKAAQQQAVRLEVVVKRELPDGAYETLPSPVSVARITAISSDNG